MATKTLTLPRVSTYTIYYNRGTSDEWGANAATYVSAKNKTMAQWKYDLSGLHAERLGRQIIISRITVDWCTSSRYWFDIRLQGEPAYGRNWGEYIGEQQGASTTSMVAVSVTRYAPHSSITLLENIINGNADYAYVSCQNQSTSATGYGTCQYGNLTIEYDYATPLNIIDTVTPEQSRAVFGGNLAFRASINNTTLNPLTRIQVDIVRESGGTDILMADTRYFDVDMPVGGSFDIAYAGTLHTWADAPRTTPLKVKVTIPGDDPEKADLISGLDTLYNPAITDFSVRRAEQGTDGIWQESDEGVHTLTDLKISLGAGSAVNGFSLRAYYAPGTVDISVADYLDLNLQSKVAEYRNGIASAVNIVDRSAGFAQNSDWSFVLVLTDGYETATATGSIFKAVTNVHLSGYPNGGVCLGGFCDAEGRDVDEENDGPALFESYYPMRAYGGIADLDYSLSETKLPARWIDGKPIWRRVYAEDNPRFNSGIFALPAISDMDALVDLRGYFTNEWGMFPIVHPGGPGRVSLYLDSENRPSVYDDYGNNQFWRLVIIMTYTKQDE